MKKILSFILVVVFLFSCVSALADTQEVLAVGYVTERLNIRKYPNIDSERVGGYAAGSDVEILEVVNGDWFRVAKGYVMRQFVFLYPQYEEVVMGEDAMREEVTNVTFYNYSDLIPSNMANLQIHYIGYLASRVQGTSVSGKSTLWFQDMLPIYDILDGYAYFPSKRDIFKVKVSYFEGIEAVGPDYQILAAYRSIYFSSSSERKHNIELVASKLDGTVIPSGGTFSYNTTTGPRGQREGYQLAPVQKNGTTELDYGGGVCQVSSTLYAAVRSTDGFRVTKRSAHGQEVTYLPVGMDATVSYGSTDFAFRNDFPFEVVLHVTTSNGGALLVTLERLD